MKWYRKDFINQYKLSLLCFPKNKSNDTIVSLRKTINGKINVICYYSRDVFPYSLISISQKDFSSLTLQHFPMEERDNIADERIKYKSVKFGYQFQ